MAKLECLTTTTPSRHALRTALVVWFGTLLFSGCATTKTCCNTDYVRHELVDRIGTAAEPTSTAPGHQVIPAGVVLEDGLSEAEAVSIALANNSAYQATLAQLGMACGDAVQASLLANPQILMYFPSGAKEGQATLYAPIESYLLRPTRERIADREYHRIGDQLVQNGLNVARDVRLAYADYALAVERWRLAGEARRLRTDIADLTQKRLKDGDISELETITSRVDALNADALVAAEQHNVNIARARLVTLIGIPTTDCPLQPDPLASQEATAQDEAQLLASALLCRPDLHAARWLVAAARERAALARRQFWRIDGVVDTRYGPSYTRTGTGLRFDLPIFNRNQGGIQRADWELNAAEHNYDALSDLIHQEVRVAREQLTQAQDNLRIIEQSMMPKISEAIGIAQKGFANGGTDYLLVLQTTAQYFDARNRLLLERANIQRARAELERSISRSLTERQLDINLVGNRDESSVVVRSGLAPHVLVGEELPSLTVSQAYLIPPAENPANR